MNPTSILESALGQLVALSAVLVGWALVAGVRALNELRKDLAEHARRREVERARRCLERNAGT